ncbi:MAG: PD-(D/E)XK nuclease family protein [Capsulimonadales bacterium]|nr:PD-(D/E)XK nuclease family protein [Capsulimonadales bacterium]
MARKFVLSPTRLRMYFRCPAEYRLEYIDKLGRLYHRARAGHAFGHSLHRALEAFHAAGGSETVSEQALTDSLETLWVAKGYQGEEQEAQFREEGARILREYHAAQVAARDALQTAPPPVLLYAEKTLRIDLTPEIALSGRIDRVDEHPDGSLEIVDYKSGRETVSVEDVSSSLALNIYQVLLKARHPDRRVFSTLVALRTGAKASYELPETDRLSLTAECAETGEEIRSKDWESVKPVPNDHCPHCDFLPHCSRYWQREERRNRLPMAPGV